MNFKKWLLTEEIYSQNKTATVYHRTCAYCDEDKSVKAVSSILTSDFKSGAMGCIYGCGFYTTYSIKSQFNEHMQKYGKALVKFKVTDLDKYLILSEYAAKKIHGENYKISDQVKKLGLLNKFTENALKEYDRLQEWNPAVLVGEFYESNRWIQNSVKGMIYYEPSDGDCLVKYEPVQDGTITMLGYAVAEHNDKKKMEELKNNIGWIKSVGVLGTSIKTAYKASDKMKKIFAFGDKHEL